MCCCTFNHSNQVLNQGGHTRVSHLEIYTRTFSSTPQTSSVAACQSHMRDATAWPVKTRLNTNSEMLQCEFISWRPSVFFSKQQQASCRACKFRMTDACSRHTPHAHAPVPVLARLRFLLLDACQRPLFHLQQPREPHLHQNTQPHIMRRHLVRAQLRDGGCRPWRLGWGAHGQRGLRGSRTRHMPRFLQLFARAGLARCCRCNRRRRGRALLRNVRSGSSSCCTLRSRCGLRRFI